MSFTKKELHKLRDNVIETVYNETGKTPDVRINIFPNGRKKKIPEFVYIFQKPEFLLVQCLKESSCKVLMYFRAVMEYHNRIDRDITDIALICHLSISTVNRALKELANYNILKVIKSSTDNRRNIYLLHPQSAWKGMAEKMKELYPYFEVHEGSRQLEIELTAATDKKNSLLQCLKKT